MNRNYIAKRTFKYGGNWVMAGEPVMPEGGRYDEILFEPSNGYVYFGEEVSNELVCDFCGAEFGSKSWLTRHMNAEHKKGD